MHHAIAMLVVLCSLVSGCHATRGAPTPPRFHASPQPAMAALPFSEVVQAGDTWYLSGQIGADPATLKLAPGGIEPETRQMLDNIQATLARHDLDWDDLVKCTVFLADMQDWPTFNRLYRERFGKHFPARSALGANGLALGARVELECIAYAPR